MKAPQSSKPGLRGIAVVVILLAAATVIPPQTVQAGGEPIVVIVNGANPVESLNISDLKKVFLSDRSKWDTGKSVAPVIVTAGASERTAFLKQVCGMSDAEFGKYFMQAAFTGKSATPPKEVTSSASVKSFVASSPGAIGFVKAMDFHGNGSDGGIKALKIDGADAGDPSYKLRM
jgi:ABC-type phosphate transport system substrate-binding protein